MLKKYVQFVQMFPSLLVQPHSRIGLASIGDWILAALRDSVLKKKLNELVINAGIDLATY